MQGHRGLRPGWGPHLIAAGAAAGDRIGICESALTPRPEHLQQTGVVHAGVVSTLAAHTAGAAAATLMGAQHSVLTSELKMHLLRPARGPRSCTATVLEPGRMFSMLEAEVRAADLLVAKFIGTLAIVDSVR